MKEALPREAAAGHRIDRPDPAACRTGSKLGWSGVGPAHPRAGLKRPYSILPIFPRGASASPPRAPDIRVNAAREKRAKAMPTAPRREHPCAVAITLAAERHRSKGMAAQRCAPRRPLVGVKEGMGVYREEQARPGSAGQPCVVPHTPQSTREPARGCRPAHTRGPGGARVPAPGPGTSPSGPASCSRARDDNRRNSLLTCAELRLQWHVRHKHGQDLLAHRRF